jgi:hypothetical protein
MAFRRFLRGQVPRETVDRVATEVVRRNGGGEATVRTLDADNWLSTPCVVNDRYFVKVITAQNSLVHALLTTGRNIGVFSSGTSGFFEHFHTPVDMAEHELAATEQMRDLGVNAPQPLEAFEFEGLGVLVLEYLRDFEPLDGVAPATVERLAPALFESLAVMHESALVHGDLRAENVLVADGDLYFIDATKVREAAVEDASAYDVACALATVTPVVGHRAAVEAAAAAYPPETLLAAEGFLDFVNIRPDHDFDAATVRGEIEKQFA